MNAERNPADVLEDLAVWWNDGHMNLGIWAELRPLCWHGWSDREINQWFGDFADAMAARDAVATGTRDWREFLDTDAAFGSEHAGQVLAERADEARDLLRFGPRRAEGRRAA